MKFIHWPTFIIADLYGLLVMTHFGWHAQLSRELLISIGIALVLFAMSFRGRIVLRRRQSAVRAAEGAR